MSSDTDSDKSLLVLIMDLHPSVWGERELVRGANEKKRASSTTVDPKKAKRAVGPATLHDIMDSTLAFCSAFSMLHRENALVVIGVSGKNCAILYPRKSALDGMISDPVELGTRMNVGMMHDSVRLGITDLVQKSSNEISSSEGEISMGSSMAAGLSLALCTINRFMIEMGGSAGVLNRREGADEAVFAMMDGKDLKTAAEERERQRRQTGVLSPRILMIQSSDDQTKDYNAFMNCTFAAIKSGITIDGCFIPSGLPNQGKTSVFLEQACDRTGGVFLAPAGAAQVGGALLEVMLSIFLAPIGGRKHLTLPAPNKVDFRARCFLTGESVDIANVCNQVSIFRALIALFQNLFHFNVPF